jgi:chorismate synthase
MSSTLGHLLRITTFGESHGGAVGVVIDGCPPRLELQASDIQAELDRRRPGQSPLATPRQEPDQAQILSGVLDGRTLGTPICILVHNQDARAHDYTNLQESYRPSHADFTYEAKYGIRSWQGGGRASARETIGRVAAGAVARKLLAVQTGVEIVAYVTRVHDLRAQVDPTTVTRAEVDATPVRCPDLAAAAAMIQRIEEVRDLGDSVGGIVEVVARGVPAGWGEPVFDKLEADLARALMSLPASRGFEIGSGFAALDLLGSQHNDAFVRDASGHIGTLTNRSGGIQGGISNGQPIIARVAFKPTSTVRVPQQTVTRDGEPHLLEMRGRHDPCVLPRAVPIVEAMTALVLADHYLRQRAQCGEEGLQPPQNE